MAKIVLLIISILIMVETYSQGTVEFTRWKDNSKAAYSLNLDDYGAQYFGNLDTIAKVYENTGLRISFAVIANSSDCDINCQQKYWDWANGRLKGNEFVAHSWTHPTMAELTPDIFAQETDSARVFIEDHINNNSCIFYIFPNNTINKPGFIEYLRTTDYIGCGGGDNDINAYNITDPYMVNRAYYFGKGVKTLNITVNKAIKQGNWGFKAAHNVGIGGWKPIPIEEYENHMNFCKQKVDAGELWMAPVTEVLKYILERENFKLNITHEDNTQMVLAWDTSKSINPSDKIDNSLFNEPLTIRVVNINGKEVIFNASPFNGNIIIKYNKHKIVSITQSGIELYNKCI